MVTQVSSIEDGRVLSAVSAKHSFDCVLTLFRGCMGMCADGQHDWGFTAIIATP